MIACGRRDERAIFSKGTLREIRSHLFVLPFTHLFLGSSQSFAAASELALAAVSIRFRSRHAPRLRPAVVVHKEEATDSCPLPMISGAFCTRDPRSVLARTALQWELRVFAHCANPPSLSFIPFHSVSSPCFGPEMLTEARFPEAESLCLL